MHTYKNIYKSRNTILYFADLTKMLKKEQKKKNNETKKNYMGKCSYTSMKYSHKIYCTCGKYSKQRYTLSFE